MVKRGSVSTRYGTSADGFTLNRLLSGRVVFGPIMRIAPSAGVTSNCCPAGGVTGSPGETVCCGAGFTPAACPMVTSVPCNTSGVMLRLLPSTLPLPISWPGFRAIS
ncbi:hypothetical protein D3C76_1483780 [compost metagenome]